MEDINLVKFNPQTNTYQVSWSANATPVSGRERLIGQLVKRILTLKGSNKFDEEYGEHFFELFGVVDRKQVEQIKEIFPVLIESLEESIINEQSGRNDLKREERLVSLDLEDVEFDESFTAWVVKIRVTTEDLLPTTLIV